MSDLEDILQPDSMSLSGLITPVVAVLLILAGVVISVLYSGTETQNEIEARRSQQLIESGFRLVGDAVGRVAQSQASSPELMQNLSGELDAVWAEKQFASLDTVYGPLKTLIFSSGGGVLFGDDPGIDGPPDKNLLSIVAEARDNRDGRPGWSSGFVIYRDRLHIASASAVGASGGVLILLREIDEIVLTQFSEQYMVENIVVHSASDDLGAVGITIRSPQGDIIDSISWKPARPGEELFGYLLVPIVVSILIAALLLANFLRNAVRATKQLKRGAVALEKSGKALEYSESMLSAIINGVADGIVTIDESGRIVSANASMSRIFGYELEELLGKNADILLASRTGDSSEVGKTLFADTNVPETQYLEFTGCRKDGGRFVLDSAISHIAYQSQAIAIAIMRDITERKQAEETLNLLATGMALVDRDGRLLMANRSASRLLDGGDGLGLRNGRVTAARREQAEHLRDLIYNICVSEAGSKEEGAGVMTIERAEGVRPLSIKVAPVELNADDSGSRVAAIFIRDLEIRQSVPPEVVAKLFGLTFAEARVVVELVKGKRPQEVADDVGVSLNTVRNQLKQIFSKTNTGRQSELVSLVLSSAAFVSEHGLDIDGSDDRIFD